MIFRVSLALFALVLIIYFGSIRRRHPLLAAGFSITFISLFVFSLVPDLSTEVAHLVGIGRGVDLAIYIAIVFLLTFTFNLYLALHEKRGQLTLLARRIARDQVKSIQLDASNKRAAIIPMYNEAAVINDVLIELTDLGLSAIVVDDGSTDQSAQRVQALIDEGLSIILIEHPINLGQGAALMTGFEEAIARNLESVLTFDSDGQHCPQDGLRLLDELESDSSLDMILGSRFLGTTEGMPRSRELLLKLAIRFTQWTGGPKLTDSHNGLRAIRRSALFKLRLTQSRMAHASELLQLMKSQGLAYKESPVTIRYTERSLAKGQSVWGALSIVRDLVLERLTSGR